MKKVSWGGAILGAILGVVLGSFANNMLFSMTKGLWSMEQGAPWIAIYAVYLVPLICGFVYGLVKGVAAGILAGIISPFLTAIIVYFACIIIGIFVSGSALTLVMAILILAGLFSGPGRVLVIVIKD